jgi:hypothetical protein
LEDARWVVSGLSEEVVGMVEELSGNSRFEMECAKFCKQRLS